MILSIESFTFSDALDKKELLQTVLSLVANNVVQYPSQEKVLSKMIRKLSEAESSVPNVIYSVLVLLDQALTAAIYSKSKMVIGAAVEEAVALFPKELRQAISRLRSAQDRKDENWHESLFLLTSVITKLNIFATDAQKLHKQLMTSGVFRSLIDLWCNDKDQGGQHMEALSLVFLKLSSASAEMRQYISRVPLVQKEVRSKMVEAEGIGEGQKMSLRNIRVLLQAVGCFEPLTSQPLCQQIAEEENYARLVELLSLMNDIAAEKPYSKHRYSFGKEVMEVLKETKHVIVRQTLKHNESGTGLGEEKDDADTDFVDPESKEKKLQVVLQKCLKECKLLLHAGSSNKDH